ncbi:MAG: GNAT family N-acetyltransferase [Chloroflexota bacterium]|nr:GNAT family N-acetyltransferase [Chloroflexota bacterium]
MLFLTAPHEMYRESYLEALQEFHAEGRNLRYDLAQLTQDFGSFVYKLLALSDPLQTTPPQITQTILWLIYGAEFIGRISLRQELDEHMARYGGHIGYEIRPSKRNQGYGRQILTLGLEKARELGLLKILVTCDINNIPSKRIILCNGGIFESTVELGNEATKILRYWIDLGE